MRKIITALLLGATIAAPLAAQGWQDRREARDGRAETRGARSDRPTIPDRSGQWRDRPAVAPGARPTPPPRTRDPRDGLREDPRGGGPRRDLRDGRRWEEGRGRIDDRRRDDLRARGDDRRWDNQRGRGDGRGWNDGRRDDRRGWNDGRRDDRYGWNDGRRFDDRRGWNQGWRNDRRYDWQGWRDRNRQAYRLPRYYAPRGFAGQYRRWAPGYRIQPGFYGSNYWIADPWAYRLPPAYGGYRWVRYYDDVMLVDTRSGLIEDILYSFFF